MAILQLGTGPFAGDVKLQGVDRSHDGARLLFCLVGIEWAERDADYESRGVEEKGEMEEWKGVR